MTGERKEELRSRIVDQLVGAFATFLLFSFVGWLLGFGDMKRDNAETARAVAKIETTVNVLQKDVSDLKMNGFAADSVLDKRVTVMEEQHRELLRRK